MISRNAVHAAVRTPADHFETHSLRLRANQQRGGRWKAKYNLDVPYTLKIRVCDSCYQADYLTAPDTLNADPTPLGRLARIQSIFMTIGAVIAGIGLVLLTPLAPDISFIGTLKGYWLAFTGAGLLVVLAAWLHQKARQKKLRAELTAKGIDLERLKRTEVRTRRCWNVKMIRLPSRSKLDSKMKIGRRNALPITSGRSKLIPQVD